MTPAGFAYVPDGPVAVPAAVRALAGGATTTPVWRNELGGLTFRVGDDRYVKWSPHGTALRPLAQEEARLAWAGRYTAVPRVVDRGADADGSWLVTAAIPARSAVDPRWVAEPGRAAAAIGTGLRALHDALPVEPCPFTWPDADRVAAARERIASGDGPASWAPEHRHLDVASALARLDDPPPTDRLVVCHGDACAPNTLVADDGTWAAHVDLGALGVADRWADLATATWSLAWNYGPGHDATLLAAYGVRPDAERIAYYRLLWDLS